MRPTPPADCRRILIVGAGGFGREVLEWSRHAWPDHASQIAGFLSEEPDRLDGFDCPLPILDAPGLFRPRDGDYLLLAIGIPHVRRTVAESLLAKDARFLTLVHPTAIVAATAAIGIGSVICPHGIVSDHAQLGRFVLMNYHASLGHDASAGDFTVLSPYATLGGKAAVAEDVFLGLHASIGPGVSVGRTSKVSANSAALHDVPPGSLAYGVPAHVRPIVS